jgi:phosphopantothenoylcysteine synthetase/decarboxylase
MNFLITAGGTREYIDTVRFISNASSGRMGYALAQAAIKAGHRVTLITTVENPKLKIQNSKLKTINVETAAQMFDAVKKFFPKCDSLIMAAAVSDYTVVNPAKNKIKKVDKLLAIKLKPTVDILKWAGKEKLKSISFDRPRTGNEKAKIVVGFALEDRAVQKNAEKKLKGKNLDMVIANTVAVIGAEKSTVQIKTANSRWMKIPTAGKSIIAGKIIRLVENLY